MTPFYFRTLCLASLVLLSFALPTRLPAQDAASLAKKLASAVEDGNSLTRLRMVIKSGGDKTTLNMQIKARRVSGKSDVLYQVIFPPSRKGQSVLLSQTGTGTPKGYTFTPPGKTASRLSQADLSGAVFGSDLAYQDIIENFFRWENQSITGQETVDRTACVILESKPGSGDSTPYGLVKSWVDPARLVTMRVEKYDTAGKLVREIETTQVSKDGKGRNIPAKLLVRRAGAGSETELDGSNIRHDVDYSDEDFTPQKMATLR